jgi:hypothetical protein
MASLTSALQQLRVEHKRAQLEVEKLGQAISVIESLNGSGPSRITNQPKRIMSAASRRKMAAAQKRRWEAVRKGAKPATEAAKTPASAPVKRKISAAGKKRIAAATRLRWAKFREAKKKAA